MTRTADIIVFSSSESGSGKSTVAFNVVRALLDRGYSVASFDLATVSALLTQSMPCHGHKLPDRATFRHHHIEVPDNADERVYSAAFLAALQETKAAFDYIVVDTDATNTDLCRLAHTKADVIVTPISGLSPHQVFVIGNGRLSHPSTYTRMIQAARLSKLAEADADIDWIVLPNRYPPGFAAVRNNSHLLKLANTFDFRVAPQLSDRAEYFALPARTGIFVDADIENGSIRHISELAARQEIRLLLRCIMKTI